MPTTPHVATMQDIADAIREKHPAGGTGPIPVSKFADRIKVIPRPATDLVRQFATFATEQTPAQMTSQRLIRCNGGPAFEVPSTVIYDALKRDEWMPVDFPPPPIGPLPSRQYPRFFEDGDNLYLGYNMNNGTNLHVINTKTGVVTEILGLPSRHHPPQAFFAVGNYIYIHGAGYASFGTQPAFDTIVTINKTTFAVSTVALKLAAGTAFSRVFNTCALLGHRLFFGWSTGTAATEIPYINTNVDPPTAGVITGLPSQLPQILHVQDNRLFIGRTAAATEITVIHASGGTAPAYTTWNVLNITGLPSRIYGGWAWSTIWFRNGNFLYIGTAAAETSIIRIQLATGSATVAPTTTQVTGLPSRIHNVFAVVGNKIYIGSRSATTEIPVINNTTGTLLTTITGLPNRSYATLAVAGHKVYLGASAGTGAMTLPIINTNDDTWSEILSLWGTSGGSISEFHLIGTILYSVSSWPFGTNHLAFDTVSDTVRVSIGGFSGLGDPGHANPVRITLFDRIDGSVLSDEFFYGRHDRRTEMAVLDLLAVNRAPSGGTVNVRVIRHLVSRRPDHMVVKNNKVWLTGATTADNGNAHNTNGINMLTKAFLPNHAAPVYIRY